MKTIVHILIILLAVSGLVQGQGLFENAGNESVTVTMSVSANPLPTYLPLILKRD